MKILKTSYKYLLLLYAPILIAGFCFAFFYSPVIILGIQILSCLFLGVILVLALSPYGKRLISSGNKKPYWQWLILLFSLQITIVFIFLVFTQSTAALSAAPNALSNNKFHMLELSAGLYPWPIYLLFAISMAHFTTDKNKVWPLKHALRPVFKKFIDRPLGAGIDILMKQSLFFSCAITIAIGVLQIATILSSILNISLGEHAYFSVLLRNMLLMLLLATALWRHSTHYLWHRGYSLKQLLPLFIILLLSFILLFNLGNKLLLPYTHRFGSALPTTQLLLQNPRQLFLSWQLFTIIWWLGWVPLAGYFIMRLGRGRSVREVILTGLIIPGIVGVLLWIIHHHPVNQHLLAILQTTPPWPLTILLSLANLILICIFYKDSILTKLFTSAGTRKNIQRRISLTVLRGFLSLILSAIVIFSMTGLLWITPLAFSVTFACVIIIISACFGYFYEQYKKHSADF